MKFETAVKQSITLAGCYRLLMIIQAIDGEIEFAVPFATGAWNHICSDFLAGSKLFANAIHKAEMKLGSVYPIELIDLDEDDLNHLSTFAAVKGCSG